MSREHIDNKNTYYYVIDGTFRTKVNENTEGAIARDYETKDGGKGVKHERVVTALSGKIEDLYFREGDYGKTINLRLDENEDGVSPVIQLNVQSNFGEDFLKKLPSIKLEEEILLRPYSFEDEEGKDRRGVAITQKDDDGHFTVKVFNHFWDNDNKKAVHGYPETTDIPKGDKEEWKIFFIKARKFLVEYTEENIIDKFREAESIEREIKRPVEDIDSDNIPF